MTSLKELYAERGRLNEQIGAIEQEQLHKRNAAYVGNCYRERYEYGGKITYSYLMVTGLDENGWFEAWSFEVAPDSQSWVRPCETNISIYGKKISRATFDKAWAAFVAHVRAIGKGEV